MTRWRLFWILVFGWVGLAPLPATPQDLNSMLLRADKLQDANRFNEALDILKEADRTNPDNPAILRRLSQVYSDLIDVTANAGLKKQYAQRALSNAKRAVQKAPDDAEAHLALSIAYGKITDYVDNKTKIEYSKYIKSEAEKAIELNPRLDDAYEILARWNFEMANLNPIERGFAQLFYGQLPPASRDKALEYFRKAISLAPNRIIHHAEYARALEQMGRANEAKAEWRKVLQLKPADTGDREYQAEAAKRVR
jgi:tetratricopeptide (TPR) repeat protein